MDIVIRQVEPDDYEALRHVFSGSQAIADTLQLPFPNAEAWRGRLADPLENLYLRGRRDGRQTVAED